MLKGQVSEEELLARGYKLENALIEGVSLSMEDHGILTLDMPLKMNGCGVVYGGLCLGKGYPGAEEFEGSAAGLEYIMRIMDVVGVWKLEKLKGCYCRVATKSWGDPVKIIGNIIDDKWFNPELFFEENET